VPTCSSQLLEYLCKHVYLCTCIGVLFSNLVHVLLVCARVSMLVAYRRGKGLNYSPQVWHMSRLPPKLIFGSIYSLQLFQLV
jgi:hypothetical protein